MCSSKWAALGSFLLAALGVHCKRTASSAPESAATGGVLRSAEVAAADAGPGFAAKAVRVPPALVDESGQLELSGVAYSAAINRYIVVSDDTGRKERGTRHAPWVFTMTANGEVDSDPLPIGGIDQLNDPESITQGPTGTYFICTSHSPNLKGHTPPERAMLLQVEQAGRSLRVLARMDLRDVEGGLLKIAGLDPNARLDIEGVAYREGELLIGLKSPLTADGASTVLALLRPVEVMKRGKLTPSDISVRARLRLAVSTPRGEVLEGISDLLFLPDKSLLVLANSPKGMPHDGGGSAWHVAHGANAGDVTKPVLLHRFSGLKPEGAALSPDGTQIVIVFDRDQDVPAMTRIDLPVP